MNCKQGDRAVCIRPSPYNPATLGLMVEVKYAAPHGRGFVLPNKHDHVPLRRTDRHYWVCKAPRRLATPRADGRMRMSSYLVIPDEFLRPIRDPGDDAIDEFARPKHDETLKPKRQLEHC